jgi:hypothetical protein
MLSMLNMLGVEQIEIYLIYLLTNIENDKKYVGQTKTLKRDGIVINLVHDLIQNIRLILLSQNMELKNLLWI